MFFLILILHVIYQPQFSLPLLLFPPIISFLLPLSTLHREFANLGVIKLRQDQDPPSCINVKQSIPPQGVGSTKSEHTPGVSPEATARDFTSR